MKIHNKMTVLAAMLMTIQPIYAQQLDSGIIDYNQRSLNKTILVKPGGHTETIPSQNGTSYRYYRHNVDDYSDGRRAQDQAHGRSRSAKRHTRHKIDDFWPTLLTL